jgi:putative DNA primase/helicase
VLHACTRTGGITAHPHPGEYAALKQLSVDLLVSLGLTTVHIAGRPAIKMPYFDGGGAEIGERLRVAFEGKSRFKWRKGTRVQPYGLWRPDRSLGSVILDEGGPGAQTLWYRGIIAPACRRWWTRGSARR